MRLLIIRHADPDYEHDSLTPQGKREAAALAEELKEVPITAAYVSPLGRARLTAKPVLEAKGMTAEVLPWLREFDAIVVRPHTGNPGIAWDWLPQDWTAEDDFLSLERWTCPGPMADSDAAEKYAKVCAGLDTLLDRHGYRREGRLYRAHTPGEDTVALFCHFGVECVLLSHLLHVSPMPLWHGTCALPSSVTRLVTEERREGIASFRILEYGSLTHLVRRGIEPSFSARFRECFYRDDQRMD
ncbi:MAG: histidine phosphatase family protein [Oscillibacter sp.]|nr:histidine phosphatase family protein [Oscillibacter sp.]